MANVQDPRTATVFKQDDGWYTIRIEDEKDQKRADRLDLIVKDLTAKHVTRIRYTCGDVTWVMHLVPFAFETPIT